MFQASIVTSLAFFVGLAVNNWRHAVLALVGSILGTLVGNLPPGPDRCRGHRHLRLQRLAGRDRLCTSGGPRWSSQYWERSFRLPLTEMFPKIHDWVAWLNPAALTAPFVFACWIVIGIGALEKYFCTESA